VVAAIVGLNLALHLLPVRDLAVSVAAAGVLLLFARASGLSWTQLGLGRAHLWSGIRWGGAVILLVGTAYLVGVLLPATRPAFLDARYELGVSEALMTAFVVIPLGTILLEEVAFRSVLWGMLSRHMGRWRVLLVSSSLFGLWHVFPSLSFASANQAFSDMVPARGVATTVLAVVGTVLFTGLGGVVAGELRRRSGSVIASAGMHWATNSFGVLFGLLAWRLAA
jgi:membrane protease YdiL (CAAX protease family)